MQARLKMKDLEVQTGVSREAIHFYLREGLLPQPQRPKKIVAHYSDEHVVRIRTIKQLQKERSLSLESIRAILDQFDYDALVNHGDLAKFELAVQARVNGALPGRDQPLARVTQRTGLANDFLQQLADLGVINVADHTNEQTIDFRDADMLDQWARLMRLGFGNRTRYDARYLLRLADAVRTLAHFEVANFLAEFGDLPSDDAATMAAEGISITNDILTRLRTQALMRVLHERVDKANERESLGKPN